MFGGEAGKRLSLDDVGAGNANSSPPPLTVPDLKNGGGSPGSVGEDKYMMVNKDTGEVFDIRNMEGSNGELEGMEVSEKESGDRENHTGLLRTGGDVGATNAYFIALTTNNRTLVASLLASPRSGIL